MTKKIIDLIEKENEIQEKILNEVELLKNYGTDCSCDNKERYSYIFWGEFPEIISVCVNCGGNLYA